MWPQKEFGLLRQKCARQYGTILHLRKQVEKLETERDAAINNWHQVCELIGIDFSEHDDLVAAIEQSIADDLAARQEMRSQINSLKASRQNQAQLRAKAEASLAEMQRERDSLKAVREEYKADLEFMTNSRGDWQSRAHQLQATLNSEGHKFEPNSPGVVGSDSCQVCGKF